MSYSPTIGRWLERDPIGYPEGLNGYEFLKSDPINRIDPMGLDSSSPLDLGWESLTGTGDRDRNFGQGDALTQQLRQHSHIQGAVEQIKKQLELQCANCNSSPISGSKNYSLSGVQGVSKYIRNYSHLPLAVLPAILLSPI